MIQNLFQTNPKEALSLFSSHLFYYLFALTLLPSILLLKTQINYPKSMLPGFLQRVVLIIILLVVAFLQAIIFYSYYSSIFRDHREVLHTANPSSFIVATADHLRRSIKDSRPQQPAIVIDKNPVLLNKDDAPIMIFVVGETSRADHYSLNGYAQDTNPLLSHQQNVFNFSKVSSCGTSTALSVPCMFSSFAHKDYDDAKGKNYENVLDVLHRAGVDAFWRDNNSDCKGVCLRIPNETPAQLRIDQYCDAESCFDEVLLKGLEERIRDSKGKPTIIVLHVMGSHGPKYYARVPQDKKVFFPECRDNVLGNCEKASLINAYDNTIIYTDYILNQLITMLSHETRPSSVFYVSDHGESLGENGMYLHGAPYMLAPQSQTHVPMILWMNPAQITTTDVDPQCLTKQQQNPQISHDYVFHTLLGLFQVQSATYRPELDLLQPCRGTMKH